MKEILREEYTGHCAGMKHRTQFDAVKQFIDNKDCMDGRVFVLYGLRRTGKTTLMEQVLSAYPPERCAFFEVGEKDCMGDIDAAITDAKKRGADIVVLDEATCAEDFISGCAILPDVFAKGGMSIILSGTDSLSLLFAERGPLLDRAEWAITTHIPFAEHARILGTKDVDDYIKYGGLMKKGAHYVKDFKSVKRYLDSAVAGNISHSLERHWYARPTDKPKEKLLENDFCVIIEKLVEIYSGIIDRDAIMAEIPDVTVNYVTSKITDDNVRVDLSRQKKEITKEFAKIINADAGLSVEISENTVYAFIGYLRDMDVLSEIERVRYTKNLAWECTAWQDDYIVQPAIKYHHLEEGKKYIEANLRYGGLSVGKRKALCDELGQKIFGDMLEQVVLFDVKYGLDSERYGVIKPEFAFGKTSAGEYDAMVFDKISGTHWAFEIKHTPNPYQGYDKNGKYNGQDKTLVRADITEYMEEQYGKRAGYAVLYTGESFLATNGTPYLNVADFLIDLDITRDMGKTFEKLTKDLPVIDVIQKIADLIAEPISSEKQDKNNELPTKENISKTD